MLPRHTRAAGQHELEIAMDQEPDYRLRTANGHGAGTRGYLAVRLNAIFFAVGMMLCFLAAMMLLPALVDIADRNDDWRVFLGSSLVTLFAGGLMVFSTFGARGEDFGRREGFAFTTLSWLIVSAFSALPFIGVGLNFTDAYFEAMSGLTTTGSTVLTHLDDLPRGVLLWRSELQGIGGIGIVVTALIALPFLRVGGMQLFHTESSDQSEKIMPRSVNLVAASAWIYAGLIAACALTYALLGMTPFDAICHALTTVSTGGFSTHDKSLAFFVSAPIEVAAIIFMMAGALPFVIFIRAVSGAPQALWTDAQVRAFVGFVAVVSVLFALWHMQVTQTGFLPSLLATTFNVVSIVTTTGFANDDYMGWSPLAVGLIFLLTFVGGCAGSTSGGMKIYRFQIAFRLIAAHLMLLMTPHRVVPLRYNGKRLPADLPFSVIAFLAVYMGSVGIVGIILAGTGLDLLTAISAAATAISNVGPGIGDIVGPTGNFATLPDLAKWVLSLAMLLGRLEIFTVLVILSPAFWRH